MDLYIFTLVLGAAGMAAMAFLGFTSSHGGGAHHGHDTAGHEIGPGAAHHTLSAPHAAGHAIAHSHDGAHGHATTAAGGHHHAEWKAGLWSWLSPRVLFNVLVGFGATGLLVERFTGPFLALPIAVIGGIAFESLIVRPIFNSLFRFESDPAQTLESAIMSEGKAVTGFDVHGNGLIAVELGGEIVQVLGTLTRTEQSAGVRVRAGDIVRIEEIDSVRNRCTVSRIGLGAG